MPKQSLNNIWKPRLPSRPFHILLCFLYLLLPQISQGQLFGLPHQERYTISSGLSNNSITDIQQDSLGFLWIGTADGLNRFDGYNFQSYHPEQADSSSISDSFISSVELDAQGKLWIGTQKGGVNIYNPKSEAFISLPMDSYRNGQTDFFMTHGQSLFLSDSSFIWMGSDKGIVQLSKSVSDGKLSFLLPEFIVYAFLKDEKGGIWVGSSAGLFYGEFPNPQLTYQTGLPLELSGEVSALMFDKNGNLLVGAKEGLFLRKEGIWEELYRFEDNRKASFSNINAIVRDKKDRIWVAGQQGLSILDGKTYQNNEKKQQVLKQNNLEKENIHCLFLDREDNLWIGTSNNGLIRLFLSEQHFPVFRRNSDPQEGGTPENTIRSIWTDKNEDIWLGSYGAGLFLFDREKLSYQNFVHADSDPASISGNQISQIYRDSENDLWVGTWGDGLNKAIQTPNGLRFIRQKLFEPEDPRRSNLAKIQQIIEDEFNNLWIGTNGGFLKKAKGKTEFLDMTPYFDIPYLSINAILEDKTGNWWIGTWNGLFIYSKEQMLSAKKGTPKEAMKPAASFYFEKDNPSSLSNNRITCLHQDSAGRIWIGTYGGGLNLWLGNDYREANGKKFNSFRAKDGLNKNVIFGILEDEQKNLWMSTTNGLVLFDSEQMTFRNYYADDGLQSNQFYFGAYGKTQKGEIIVGGTNGFNIFDPLLFSQDKEIPPPVLFTEILIQGEKISPKKEVRGKVLLEESILYTKKLVLDAEDKGFRIGFLSPSLNHANKLKYAYRLKGLRNNWEYSSTDRFAVYENLYEGNYDFEVKASLDGKNWSEVNSIRLKILPPWYRTWWTYLIFGIFIISFLAVIARLAFIYSNLRNKLKLEQLSRQKEAEINQMRLWFFTYISHEFRTPLGLIISPLTEILSKSEVPEYLRKKLLLTYKSSQRLLRLVNQILNFRMINSGKTKLNVSEQDLVIFIHEIFQSFSSLADERWINYQFNTNFPRISVYFDKEKMELILYNLISNAFKYSQEGGQIIVQIDQTEAEVIISVKDQGLGIDDSMKEKIFEPFQQVAEDAYSGSGIGLALVKDLTELHKGHLALESKKGVGSKFSISLKKGKDHFNAHDLISHLPETAQTSYQQNFLQEIIEDTHTAVVFPELAGKEKLKMLILEDNREMRKYLVSHFNQHFTVYEAADGLEGWGIVQEKGSDIIISDVIMPKMDGISFVKRLKSKPQTQHIPVLLLSSRTHIDYQLEGLGKGAFEYISKPVNIHLLKAKVASIVRNIQQLREHYKHESILPQDPNLSSTDEQFLLQAAQIIERNMENSQFNAAVFAEQMGISRSGLYKRLQAKTGKSTTEFMRYVRIKHAEKLLRDGNLNISQTAFKVGFNDLKYFRKCFKAEHGLTPTQYIAQVSKS